MTDIDTLAPATSPMTRIIADLDGNGRYQKLLLASANLNPFQTSHGTYVVRVKGCGFESEAMRDGDWIVVEKRHTAMVGEKVIATVAGERTVIATLRREGALELADGTVVRSNEIAVQGVVMGIIRRL